MIHLVRFRIIIVHRNGHEMLTRCLASVAKAKFENDEVVVVDNGSTDDSCAVIKQGYPWIRLFENGCNNGFAAANNQALKHCRAQYVLLLNNDAFLSVETLNTLEDVFESSPDIAVVTPQLTDEKGNKQRSYGFFMRPMDEVLPKPLRKKNTLDLHASRVDVDTVIGACMAIRMTAINQVGRLDDDFFFYFEETEWCYRFKQQGYRVVLDQSIKVVHEKGVSSRAFSAEVSIEMLRSRLLYYSKVFPKNTAFLLEVYRSGRLLVNFIFASILGLLTLGLYKKGRNQWRNYGLQLAWLLRGKPMRWGLPDKCLSCQTADKETR